MDTFERELVYLNNVVEELEDYILSKTLYWPISIPGKSLFLSNATLTIGNVYFSLQVLENDLITPDQIASRQNIIQNIEKVSTHWRINWAEKAKAEFTSRLLLWENFLQDLLEEKRGTVQEYKSQVRNRVLLRLLEIKASVNIPQQFNKLNKIDDAYNKITQETDFIWDRMLITSFPKRVYHFLYRAPI